MTESMIERVARNMARMVTEPGQRPDSRLNEMRFLARAAIEAMRVPTEAMIEAGCLKGTNITPSGPSYRLAERTAGERMKGQWSAMLEAALSEKGE